MIKALLTTITVILILLIVIPVRQYAIQVTKLQRKNWTWKPKFKKFKKKYTYSITWLNFEVKFWVIDLRK